MCEPPVVSKLKELERLNVVLYGFETHVCVKQTALDLLEMGYNVHLVVDAVSSMEHHDRNVGIESIRDAGASLTTYQSLMFELMRTCEHPNFKQVLNIVKEMPKKHLDLHFYNSQDMK